MPHHLHVVADEELEMLVRAHEAALLRLAYLLCRDSARAEDLVQDAFLRVLGRWRSAGVPDQPFAYARKVVINEYLAWRRLRSASGQVGPVGDAEAFDHVEQLADRELADVEIATILGCRQATVRSISARALQLLRAHPMMAIVLEEA